VKRLREVAQGFGEQAEPNHAQGIMGLIEEGDETIEEGAKREPITSDLALIAAAQRIEIACYGTVPIETVGPDTASVEAALVRFWPGWSVSAVDPPNLPFELGDDGPNSQSGVF
jgi:hypothetical protein